MTSINNLRSIFNLDYSSKGKKQQYIKSGLFSRPQQGLLRHIYNTLITQIPMAMPSGTDGGVGIRYQPPGNLNICSRQKMLIAINQDSTYPHLHANTHSLTQKLHRLFSGHNACCMLSNYHCSDTANPPDARYISPQPAHRKALLAEGIIHSILFSFSQKSKLSNGMDFSGETGIFHLD